MRTQIFKCTDDGIASCALLIKSGEILVFPTDTIYGIGCDPYNDQAVERIFVIKGRGEKKPLPVLAYSAADIEKIVSLGDAGKVLARKYWPGALTIVAPIIDQKISRRVTAAGNSLAVRVPANKCVLSLLKRCRYLVGTSANPSGDMPPKSAQEVLHSSLRGYDALLDGGPVEKGIESTIVDITGSPKVLREGTIKASEVLELLGRV
ncbi:MAG TPA: L-threonylcarbamoyladenylate synthase [Nitrososphaera sp.]|jgi:L-threonylcarbamoyladenylate synthase|nr:L-threonylcarbamoyladenylate synthase [Nitrososphaera sp.]